MESRITGLNDIENETDPVLNKYDETDLDKTIRPLEAHEADMCDPLDTKNHCINILGMEELSTKVEKGIISEKEFVLKKDKLFNMTLLESRRLNKRKRKKPERLDHVYIKHVLINDTHDLDSPATMERAFKEDDEITESLEEENLENDKEWDGDLGEEEEEGSDYTIDKEEEEDSVDDLDIPPLPVLKAAKATHGVD